MKKREVPQSVKDEVERIRSKGTLNWLEETFGKCVKLEKGISNESYVCAKHQCLIRSKRYYSSSYKRPDACILATESYLRHVNGKIIWKSGFGWMVDGRLYSCRIKLSFKGANDEALAGDIKAEKLNDDYGLSQFYAHPLDSEEVEDPVPEERISTDLVHIFPEKPYSDITEMLKDKYPGMKRRAEAHNIPYMLAITGPYICNLKDLEYGFLADAIISGYANGNSTSVDIANRLCRNGNTEEEIFNVPATVYKTLKTCDVSLDIWDICRKLSKRTPLKPEEVKDIAFSGYSGFDLKNIISILSADKKTGTTMKTYGDLKKYLRLLDENEYIPESDGLRKMVEYQLLCGRHGAFPDYSDTNLDRRIRELSRKMCYESDYGHLGNAALRKAQGYDYSDDTFFVRGLFNEADIRRVVNCTDRYRAETAFYRNNEKSSGEGRTAGNVMIFMLGEKNDPDCITDVFEIWNNDFSDIRKAGNYKIIDSRAAEFVEKWKTWIRDSGANRESDWDKAEAACFSKKPGMNYRSLDFYEYCCSVLTTNYLFDDLDAVAEIIGEEICI